MQWIGTKERLWRFDQKGLVSAVHSVSFAQSAKRIMVGLSSTLSHLRLEINGGVASAALQCGYRPPRRKLETRDDTAVSCSMHTVVETIPQ